MYNSHQGIVYHWSKKGVPDSHQVQLQCCRADAVGAVFKLPLGAIARAVALAVNTNYGYGSGFGLGSGSLRHVFLVFYQNIKKLYREKSMVASFYRTEYSSQSR
jgi:hypothetical protein